MRDTFAVRSATPLWAAMMRELLKHDHPIEPVKENEKLKRREVCAETGLLASVRSNSKINELFLKGTEPKQDSASWLGDDGTLLLPNEYAAWCASSNNTQGARVRAEARITNPIANARYEIDPVLPLAQQMIELTATLGRDVRWSVNDVPQLPRDDGRVFWQLAPGEWRVRATNSSLSAEETIFVE
jgi:hypothetical protein